MNYSLRFGIVLILTFLCLSLQAQFEKKGCGCDLDQSKFSDARYAKAVVIGFRLTALRDNFTYNGKGHTQVINVFELAAKNLSTIKRMDAVNALSRAEREVATLMRQGNHEAEMKKFTKDIYNRVGQEKSWEPWFIYGLCELAERTYRYYETYPSDAPSEVRGLYGGGGSSSSSSSSGPSLGFGGGGTGGGFGLIALIITGLVSALLSILIAFILVRANRGPKEEDITARILSHERLVQPLAQLQDEANQSFRRDQKLAQDVETALNALKKDNEELKRENRRLLDIVNSIPKVNVNQVQDLLNEFNRRIQTIESKPVTKDNIIIDPEALTKWLIEHPAMRQKLKDALDVTLLHDTIVRILPRQLEGAELDQLEQETLRRFWRMFEIRPEYLPKFKQELLQQIRR